MLRLIWLVKEYPKRISFFYGNDVRDLIQEIKLNIKQEIEGENEDQLISVDEEDYINYLIEQYCMEPIELFFEKMTVQPYEAHVPSSALNRSGIRVYNHTPVLKQILAFYIPYSGNIELMSYNAHFSISPPPTVFVEDGCIGFEIINQFERDPSQLDKVLENRIKLIRDSVSRRNGEIEIWNQDIKKYINEYFRHRKYEIIQRKQFLSQLTIPIRKRNDVSPTFTIPTNEIRKRVQVKPVAKVKPNEPEPTIDEETYFDILKVIYDVGKVMERLPSIYRGRQEEDLRDLFLLYLEPRYEANTTGETFNGQGKTDILIRYQNTNVFIAECKFWKGKQGYFKTIDQLLGYLTWRDSKAAVIIFNRNKGFTNVIQTVEKETPNHPNFVSFVDRKSETWFNYRFHLNTDKDKEVHLAVLLFDFPERAKGE